MNTKLILLDCDGCLTDGGYYVSDGHSKTETFKKFYTKDWHRINQILAIHPDMIKIVTASQSKCIDYHVQRMPHKCEIIRAYNKLDEIYKRFVQKDLYKWEEICYIGDDDIDMPLLEKCGLAACPADAADEVIELVSNRLDGIVLKNNGGCGCVREMLDIIVQTNKIKVKSSYECCPTSSF